MIDFKSKTLKTLQFQNPGKLFSSDTLGKRKPKVRSKYDEKISINFNYSFNYLIKNLNESTILKFFYLDEKMLYDQNGFLVETGQDICDCLRNNCPGCHFECKQCKSLKCGNKCRIYRNWYFEKIEIEGFV